MMSCIRSDKCFLILTMPTSCEWVDVPLSSVIILGPWDGGEGGNTVPFRLDWGANASQC